MKPLRNDLLNYTTWRCRFALLPHRCDITNRIIWLEYAWCAEPSWITTYEDYKTIWHDEQEHLIWVIKNA
jgi:hypothetical protein